MAEALAKVRRELGSGAVILHTRSYKSGGVLGIGARSVAEVTAADGRQVGRRRREDAERRRAAAPRAKALDKTPAAGDLIRRTYAAAKAQMEQSPAPPAVVATGPPGPDPHQLAQEMRSVKRMVSHMIRQQKRQPRSEASGDLPGKLFDRYLALLEQEVAEELADQIVQQVRQRLSDEQIDDETVCRQAMCQAVAGLLPTDESAGATRPTPDGRPRTIALVGPTGVGKTTTIAKLAATFKLKQNKKVGLITLDTYRIAAVDQLRTYAGIIGVPLHVVLSPDELRRTMGQCADCDLVLIDTAGRSQRDDQRLDELASFVGAAQPHEVHLVLSSTCTQAVLMDAVNRFSKIRTDRIIFTKLDEAVTFGVLLNVLSKVNKTLSYLTTGQEVPHHIEPGRPDRLAALVLGEGAEKP